ncbi:MAG: hypothetical protein LQ350_003009 [Teloschistes chrysophthalmus]|nr:MAG: hypothetical protein LQ350_003009 [Niorma chrysophthalma]
MEQPAARPRRGDERHYNVALVGLGHRGYKTHFQNILGSRSETIVAACDMNATTRSSFSSKHPDVPVFASLQELLAECRPDFAIVCVPHQFHLQCVELLSSVGIPVLKEKPAADSQSQFDQLLHMPVKIGVAFQKRFEPRYVQLEKLLPLVGDVASFRAVLAMNIKDLDATWRANTGVGVTEDLGCHLLNIIVSLFGRPSSLVAHQVDSVRQFQTYSGDDISNIIMHWKSSSIIGHVHLSRVAHRAEESITITGTNGTLRLEGNKVVMLDISGSQVLEMVDTTSKRTIIGAMHRKFGDYATGRATEYPGSLGSLADTVAVGEAIKQSFATHQTQDLPPVSETSVASLDGAHHVWPLITSESTDAVVKQSLSSLSIYDRSNIYQVFEDRWQKMHGLKHALTCSSGTIAIFHMFEALDLRPGDEILCPVYTFFATATPMLQYGAVPVFCDALPNGNIDPLEILNKSTPKTKAVIITHMWGLPCDMPKIMENAEKVNGGIKVLEDCSHAHGASIGDRLVGTWGHMAAWSLQAKKNVTGGQAGVFATNDTDFYAHAILHGHFNKRAKQEVPQHHRLRKFWLTGLGLNLRAHPLAIALANQQLDNLPSWMTHREKYATSLAKKLSAIPFLSMPTSTKNPQHKHAWYAFVMQFRAEKAPRDLSREQFVKALEAHGLSEVDIPRSTGLLNELPIFSHTHEAIPRYGDGAWHDPQPNDLFPTALAFYERAIKLPMWATPADWPIVEHYGNTFVKVAEDLLGREIPRKATRMQAGPDRLVDTQRSMMVRAKL